MHHRACKNEWSKTYAYNFPDIDQREDSTGGGCLSKVLEFLIPIFSIMRSIFLCWSTIMPRISTLVALSRVRRRDRNSSALSLELREKNPEFWLDQLSRVFWTFSSDLAKDLVVVFVFTLPPLVFWYLIEQSCTQRRKSSSSWVSPWVALACWNLALSLLIAAGIACWSRLTTIPIAIASAILHVPKIPSEFLFWKCKWSLFHIYITLYNSYLLLCYENFYITLKTFLTSLHRFLLHSSCRHSLLYCAFKACTNFHHLWTQVMIINFVSLCQHPH